MALSVYIVTVSVVTTREARDSRSRNDREDAEALVVSVDGVLDEHFGSELGPELLGRLQVEMLQVLYLELRHGHDQQAAHTSAITRQN